MKNAKPTAKTPSTGIVFILLLAVILAALFCKSFLPDYVHFSNDGPFGQLNARWLQLPTAFAGCWSDLNDIGNNAGAWPPDLNALSFWMLGPVGYSKFFVPIVLFFLGFSAWCFFRQLKFSPLAAGLGALAAALNSAFFSPACWGVASQQLAIGLDFLALALVVSNSPETPALVRWTRLSLAGLAVGINVMEAVDIGAMFSVFVAAFVLFRAVTDKNGPVWATWGRGIMQVAVIAIFAGFIATQTVVALVGSQITGIAGTRQDTETKAEHWDWATQWSVPKKEALGLFVPGLFGFRMDTPKNMMDFLQDAYKGGNYWGGVGRDPAIDRFFASGKEGAPPPGMMRFSGGGNYAGVLVTLVALWAMAQSLRRQNPVFTETQQRFIWFWSVTLIVSLLLAFGRFAPFYKWLYMLPYVSTMRNPCKFLAIFSWALVILFAYGIHGLSRRYMEISPASTAGSPPPIKNWWMKVRGFDRNWTVGCALTVIASLLGWLIYATEKPALIRYLQAVGFPDEGMAKNIAAFSIGQVGWFVVLFAVAVGLCTLTLAGFFAGRRAKLGGFLLGTLLILDLARANLPYIIHWDYKQKYEIGSLNPIVDALRAKPYEGRVAGLPFNAPSRLPFYDDWFGDLYRIEWAQHHFPYYNIQSLDKIQMPRMPADLMAYEMMLAPRSDDAAYLLARRWELTNTRYLLGPAGFLDVLNEQLDPGKHRFRIAQRFDVVTKPGILQPTELEQLTAVVAENGGCALFEFTGALPRVRLYSNWQTNNLDALRGFVTNGLSDFDLKILASVGTNDFLTLKKLVSPSFDPWQTVLLSDPLPEPPANAASQNAGTVEFKSYAPKNIVLRAQVNLPSVLLLNDKYDPHWRVLVDGKPAELLCCNFIMRGVYLAAGAHTIEFHFSLPNGPLYVTLTAIVMGIFLCGYLWFAGKRAGPDSRQWRAAPKPTAPQKSASSDLKR